MHSTRLVKRKDVCTCVCVCEWGEKLKDSTSNSLFAPQKQENSKTNKGMGLDYAAKGGKHTVTKQRKREPKHI